MPLRRYAEFRGRSRRREYWMFILGYAILLGPLLFFLDDTGTEPPAALVWLVLAVIAATILPALAVQVRRFHDLDRSGWYVLLNLIPYVGSLIVLVMMCQPGTMGPNRFGADPLGPDNDLANIFG